MAQSGIRPLLDDDARLGELGYRRVFARVVTPFGNFATSFAIICVLAGCLTSYGIGMNDGGPAVIMWGWVVVSLGTLALAASMGEIASAYPTAGGLYFWSAKLARRRGRVWGWYTGCFNALGQVAVTTAIDYGLAQFIGAFAALGWGMQPTVRTVFGIFAVVVLTHGVLNTTAVRWVALLSKVSVWWMLGGVLLVVGVLAFVPAHHQSAAFVFSRFVNNTSFTSFHSGLFVAGLGLLLGAYTFTGEDGSAHLSEETTGAALAAPRGIVRSVWVSAVAGFVLLGGVTFTIQNYGVEAGASVPVEQILLDALGTTLTLVLMGVIIVAQYFCGLASVTSNSRMLFAFSRDGAVPLAGVWHKVSPRTQTPVNTVWLAVSAALLLGASSLKSSVFYTAVTSIAVIGLDVACVIPVYLRLRSRSFALGPWNLGRWSRPVGVAALLWVGVISLLFMAPTAWPIHYSNANFTIVAVGVLVLLATAWWPIARRRFDIPRAHLSAEQAADELDLDLA